MAKTTLPATMLELIQQGDVVLPRIAALANKVTLDNHCPLLLAVNDVRIMAPIPRPLKKYFLHWENYAAHAMEFDKLPTPMQSFPNILLFSPRRRQP